MSDPIIRVRKLSKNFLVSSKKPGLKGTLRHFLLRQTIIFSAVKDISFEISSGEIVGFIGPNGAGKTTTLKMLCGLIHPSSGFASVMGHIPHLRKNKFLRDITLVMGQKQQLMWDLPPMDSLKVNASIYGLDEYESNRRISELADMLELGSELYRPVRKLSLGQRMKAELLAALIHHPTVLFLDEPTLGLDINSQVRVRNFLTDYNKKYSSTILLTSHYMGDITSLCERVIVIDHGSIFYDGLLTSLTQKLTPYKSITIEFQSKVPYEELNSYGEVINYSDFLITILIRRECLTQKLSLILDSYAIKDLEVTEPPIEKLIAELFQNNNINF